MLKVKTLLARKDYPESGIKKGDTYYSWSFFRQKPIKSLTPPKPSQLTQTKMSGAYAAREALEDAIDKAACPEDISEALMTAAGEIDEVVSEYESSLSELEDAFQGGSPTIDDHNEKKDALETYSNDLTEAASEIDGLDVDEYVTEGAYNKKPGSFDDLLEEDQTSMMDTAREIASNVTLDV